MEVLLTVGVLVLLASLLLPSLSRGGSSKRIVCVNNLKQVGLSFRIWYGESVDRFPMQVSLTNGGTLELVRRGAVWPHFLVMSNELDTPKGLGLSG